MLSEDEARWRVMALEANLNGFIEELTRHQVCLYNMNSMIKSLTGTGEGLVKQFEVLQEAASKLYEEAAVLRFEFVEEE